MPLDIGGLIHAAYMRIWLLQLCLLVDLHAEEDHTLPMGCGG